MSLFSRRRKHLGSVQKRLGLTGRKDARPSEKPSYRYLKVTLVKARRVGGFSSSHVLMLVLMIKPVDVEYSKANVMPKMA